MGDNNKENPGEMSDEVRAYLGDLEIAKYRQKIESGDISEEQKQRLANFNKLVKPADD